MKREKIFWWIKEHENLIMALIMMFLPLLCCVVTCALEGKNITSVYLPASEWNDELFYFKQVEGVLNFGYPQGYFGFNESHALKLSFAAWSPVLVWPWLLWGLLFGWNLQSPIYCNIVLMMLTMFGFVRLVKPTKKQLGLLALLFVSFTPFTRYMLSGMPEVICFSAAIFVFALGISYQRKEHMAKLVILFVLTAIMVLMRPYFILFMIFPVYFAVKRRKWLGIGISALVVGITGVIYIAVNHYLSAEYLEPLYETNWISEFLNNGILAGLKYVLYRLWTVGETFLRMLVESFWSGLATGARFAVFILVMLLLFWQALVHYRKKEKDEFVRYLFLGICFFGMWMALLLMKNLHDGGKHLHTFTAVGIFAISLMKTRFYRKTILTAAVFVYLYVIMATNAYEYQIPYVTEERAGQMEVWENVFDEHLMLNKDRVPNYENGVIWMFDDEVGEQRMYTPWQYLYALPEGFGISCCLQTYVVDDFGKLQCKYLVAPTGGKVDKMCAQAGLNLLADSGGMVFYELH